MEDRKRRLYRMLLVSFYSVVSFLQQLLARRLERIAVAQLVSLRL